MESEELRKTKTEEERADWTRLHVTTLASRTQTLYEARPCLKKKINKKVNELF